MDIFLLYLSASFLLLGYLAGLVVYRLYWSSLSVFPGPKLAALSNWYEFYFDVVLDGRFTAKIQELHKQYGPLVRITPTELHINEPSFYDTLYRSGPRDKYEYMSGRFGFASDTFSTAGSDLHRLRRKALNPAFSARKIDEFQPVIRKMVEVLCEKIAKYQDGQVLPLDRAWVALTTDVITEYAFSRSYNHLDTPNFQGTLHEAVLIINTTSNFALHFPFVFQILDRAPEWLVRITQPAVLPANKFRKDLERQVQDIRRGVNDGYKRAEHLTIFHELLNSTLPPEEKTDARLRDEALLVIMAGLVTTSWALTVASFHLSNNPDQYQRLRNELDAAGVRSKLLDWHQLEQLPYLYGCVHEAIRLSHGVVARSPRLVNSGLQFGKWIIPPNTPVSMNNVDILMNKDVFPEPSRFIPERWIGRPELERYFVAFGKGSRACAGINLAQAELYIAIAMVFGRFEFELFETGAEDVEMVHACLAPYPKKDSKGVRVKVRSC